MRLFTTKNYFLCPRTTFIFTSSLYFYFSPEDWWLGVVCPVKKVPGQRIQISVSSREFYYCFYRNKNPAKPTICSNRWRFETCWRQAKVAHVSSSALLHFMRRRWITKPNMWFGRRRKNRTNLSQSSAHCSHCPNTKETKASTAHAPVIFVLLANNVISFGPREFKTLLNLFDIFYGYREMAFLDFRFFKSVLYSNTKFCHFYTVSA